MTSFNRYMMSRATSWAFVTFKKHHTEINNLYWSFSPSSNYLLALSNAVPATQETATLLNVSGPNARRVPATVGELASHLTHAADWLRLSLIVATTGYLETYIKSIVECALRSRPGILYEKPGAIEGVSWLKLGIAPDIKFKLQSVTKDTWPKRFAAYKSIFGALPVNLSTEVAALEKLRATRNGASHTFGRKISHLYNDLSKIHEPLLIVTEADLVDCLARVDRVATSIDQHLQSIVGEFELLRYFHEWRSDTTRGRDADKPIFVRFKSHVARLTDQSYSADFMKELIEFYDAC